MDTTKIVKSVASTTAGDDGEALSNSEKSASMPTPETPVRPMDLGWYVAVVRCNCERRIADSIQCQLSDERIWFESWVPMRKVHYIDKRTNKRRTKDKIFLSTFIFCHVGKSHLDKIRFRSDVYKMLTMPGERTIYRIPDTVLDNYRHIVDNPDLPVNPHTGPLKKGQRVRVTEGCMAGVVAYVQSVKGKKAIIGNEIKYVSGATIEIERAFLEAVDEE